MKKNRKTCDRQPLIRLLNDLYVRWEKAQKNAADARYWDSIYRHSICSAIWATSWKELANILYPDRDTECMFYTHEPSLKKDE